MVFQHQGDRARDYFWIIREDTNISESRARTLLLEVPSMSESPGDGVQSWTESMSARDRIRAVAEMLREPRSVN